MVGDLLEPVMGLECRTLYSEQELELDLRELVRLKRIRTLLELPAYAWERWGQGCDGKCEDPRPIVRLLPDRCLTCCHFKLAYDELMHIEAAQKMIRSRVNRGRVVLDQRAAELRRQQARKVALAEAFSRTFTGTGVYRRLNLDKVVLSSTTPKKKALT